MALTTLESILGPQKTTGDWYDSTLLSKAKLHGEACPVSPPTDAEGLNNFVLLQYYDLTLGQYAAYQRTGDTLFQSLARRCADAQWKHPEIGSGKVRLWPDSVSPSPRHAGVMGLLARATDGRSEMFDWLVSYTVFHLNHWCTKRVSSPELFYGLREGAFSLRFAVALAKVLPDSYPLQSGGTATNGAEIRRQLIADIEAVCVNYYGRLQKEDGSWRWDDVDYVDSDGGTLKGIMQPFMVGLLLRALIDAHSIVDIGSNVKGSIESQVLRACIHLYNFGPYVKDQVVPAFNVKARGFHYFYHGGTTVNPTKYAKGDIPDPWNTTERWHVESARQAISTIVGAFAYAHKVSNDPFFKTAGDELWRSAYSGEDGFRGMMADTAKNYNQNVQASSYQAWLASEMTTPTPPVDSIPVVKITSPSDGSTLAGSTTVTTAITDTAEITVAYLIVDGSVVDEESAAPYSFILDTAKLKDGAHSIQVRAWNDLNKAGDSTRINVTVANVPPVTTPPPLRTVAWPKQISKQNSIIQAQWKERYKLNGIKEGGSVTAEFERVA